VGLAATVVAFYVGQAILHGNGFTGDNGYPAATLADESVLRDVAMVGVYPAVLALLSLSAGVIVRHTGAAISVLLGLLFVPWIVGALLPEDLGLAIEKGFADGRPRGAGARRPDRAVDRVRRHLRLGGRGAARRAVADPPARRVSGVSAAGDAATHLSMSCSRLAGTG
jgi:hypothetical protein